MRHDPLLSQVIDAERKATVAGSQKVGGKKKDRGHQEETEFMSAKISHKTLAMAREQQAEMEADGRGQGMPSWSSKGAASGRAAADSDSDADFSDEDVEDAGGGLVRMEGDLVEVQDMDLDEADEAALAAFMGGGEDDEVGGGGGGGGGGGIFGLGGGSLNLADLIMEKIREKEARDAGEGMDGEGEGFEGPDMNPKVVAVYTSIGKLLKVYRAGKLPKAFKIIPALTNWEEVVWITAPHEWSAQAMYAATRIFASNMNPRMSQRFFNVFLLETVRDDIRSNNGALNYHYYRALKKTLYRPAAFFKGILLPLCESGSCTLREAAILGSVVAKVSVPIMHSAAALLRLAQMRYSGPISILMRVILDKKYSLPYSVIDAVVNHFLRMTKESRALSVLWHQSLLVFIQRYKQDITRQQKEHFKDLFKKHTHHSITPEARRELFSSRCRGEKAPQTTVSMLD